MDLQEEYFLRHKLDLNKLFRFISYNNLLLKRAAETTINKRYLIFNIRQTNREGAAGLFDFFNYYPTHNGHKSRNLFSGIQDEKYGKCHWEDYEDVIVALLDAHKKRGWVALGDRAEIMLSCWEILLYSYDSFIVEMPETLIDRIYDTFDCKDTEQSRKKVMEVLQSLHKIGTASDGGQSNIACKTLLQGWSLLNEWVEPHNYAFWLLRFFK